MTEDNPTDDGPRLYNISRRRVLGGLGAIGLASAGAGLGTSAFFSDTETYENNVLTAGALDLMVDWEEHYSDWSADESDGLAHAVSMSDPNDEA
jgi:predicted ribosomally synthesized peptide with SipW-like signal peptide